jgi:hypothetical protein
MNEDIQNTTFFYANYLNSNIKNNTRDPKKNSIDMQKGTAISNLYLSSHILGFPKIYKSLHLYLSAAFSGFSLTKIKNIAIDKKTKPNANNDQKPPQLTLANICIRTTPNP